MAKSYIVYNSTATAAAAPVKQPTGTSVRSMLQIRPATGIQAVLIAWGCSFDGSTAATPGQVEVFETDAAGTLSTALAAGDVQPYNDYNATAQTAGAGGVPLNLSTTTSAFATAAGTENTITNYRAAWVGMIAPTNQYDYQFPLGREFAITPQRYLRCRVTFGASVFMTVYFVFEI